jgi:hypothetical protein
LRAKSRDLPRSLSQSRQWHFCFIATKQMELEMAEIINSADEGVNDDHNERYDAVDIARAAARELLDSPDHDGVASGTSDDDDLASQVEDNNDSEAAYKAAVERGKAIVASISGKQWALGDEVDAVTKIWGEVRLADYCKNINFSGAPSTLGRCRDVCRAFPKNRVRPRFFASAQYLATLPDRFKIVERNPDISKAEARKKLHEYLVSQGREKLLQALSQGQQRDEDENEREPLQAAAAESNLTEATTSEESAISPKEAQSPETEPDEDEDDYDDEDEDDYEDEFEDEDKDDQSEPDAGSAEWHTRRWWRGLLKLEHLAASYAMTPEYAPKNLLLTVVEQKRLARMEARFEAVLATIKLLKRLFEEPGKTTE